MLSPLTRIASQILKKRVQLKLSQGQVARQIGCSQSYICQIEKGVRTVSLRIARQLEVVLKAKAGSYRKAEFRRGRPPGSPEALAVIREITQARGLTPRPLVGLGLPRHPRPDRVRSLENPLWPIAIHLGAEAQNEVSQLERLRPNEEHFWRQLNSIPYDSWTEKRFQVRVGLTGAPLLGLSTGRLGCTLPGVNGQNGRCSRRKAYPAYVFREGELCVALFPQRCVGTAVTHRCPDSLVVAAYRGQKITAVLETDGAEHHSDQRRERRRDEELAVPVLHIDAGEVFRPDLIGRVTGWLRCLFGR